MTFQSRGVRSLVELHEVEMHAFLEVWKRFTAARAPMPEAHGDEDYASRERILGHVLMAARGYLTRIGEWLERPVDDVDATQDPLEVAARSDAFAEAILDAYRRHLASVTKEEFEPQIHRARWGELMSVELMLEHAVVHPMRHRVQLERILAGEGA